MMTKQKDGAGPGRTCGWWPPSATGRTGAEEGGAEGRQDRWTVTGRREDSAQEDGSHVVGRAAGRRLQR